MYMWERGRHTWLLTGRSRHCMNVDVRATGQSVSVLLGTGTMAGHLGACWDHGPALGEAEEVCEDLG